MKQVAPVTESVAVKVTAIDSLWEGVEGVRLVKKKGGRKKEKR